MPGNEAMRLFVKTLEEDEADWYSYPTSADETPAEDDSLPGGNPGLRSMPPDDCWRTPWVAGEKHPHPRFEHSSCLIGSTMYVFGGNTGALPSHLGPRPSSLAANFHVHARLPVLSTYGQATFVVSMTCRIAHAAPPPPWPSTPALSLIHI